MNHRNFTANPRDPIYPYGGPTRKVVMPLFLLFLFIAVLPFQGYAAEPTYPISADVKTTRDRAVSPVPLLNPGPTPLTIGQVELYAPTGYSSWQWDTNGVDYGPLLLDGTAAPEPTPAETLLSFFSMSDIHITDKESPAQWIYSAVNAEFGNVNTSAYSPILLSTTHVLDAAVQTINALHYKPGPAQAPFDFGISLGDAANSNQYNELRWFIDVMDGKKITPSSGAHVGAKDIDYQKAYQSAGLDKSIPWYQVMGNHDQYWIGTLEYNDYARRILVGKTVIDMGNVGEPPFPSFDARGIYMGVLDGSTEYGSIVGDGPAGTMPAPVVAADPKRHALSTETSTSLNWMKEFFKTTSNPRGHGFTQANLDRDFASYTFEPKASVPLKVIVLDDTCKTNPYVSAIPLSSYARGCLDQTRYEWLVNELDQGQAEGKLMIIAAHIPVGPQSNVPDNPVEQGGLANNAILPLFLSTCTLASVPVGVPCPEGTPVEYNAPVPPYTVVADASLLATLHNYPNLLLWISGHRHINTVTPQPAPLGWGPEFGFWEVETSSLRDFPQQFRTFKIVRNTNNTVSIFITDVDPAVQEDPSAQHESLSPAAKSRGYAIGANRISVGGAIAFTDTTPHVYNAELIKPLPAPYTMTVNVTGPGTVASSPYSGINCPGDSCSAAYLPGTQVTLVATPGANAAFAGWSTCTGKSTCTIPMSGNVSATATFTQAPTASVTPVQKDFGSRRVGTKAAATFTVTNTATKGVANLAIGPTVIGGTGAGQFKLAEGQDGCSGQTLMPGKSCNFQVSFKPASANTKVATITVPSNDPGGAMVIQVTGVGK